MPGCTIIFEPLKEQEYSTNTVVINLNSGEATDESVNVFQAKTIRESLIQGMVEKWNEMKYILFNKIYNSFR